MELISKVKYERVSPRKVRLVAKTLKDRKAKEALQNLEFVPNEGARVLRKALKSAIANATNNSKLNENLLKIKTVEVGNGPILKRGRAIARGSFHRIMKRGSHIKIILEG